MFALPVWYCNDLNVHVELCHNVGPTYIYCVFDCAVIACFHIMYKRVRNKCVSLFQFISLVVVHKIIQQKCNHKTCNLDTFTVIKKILVDSSISLKSVFISFFILFSNS